MKTLQIYALEEAGCITVQILPPPKSTFAIVVCTSGPVDLKAMTCAVLAERPLRDANNLPIKLQYANRA